METRVITTNEEFMKLEPVWREVYDNSGSNNIFLTWEWCSLWWRHYGEDYRLRVIYVLNKETVIGIAPFVIPRKNRLCTTGPVLKLMGAELSDYLDIIIARDHEEAVEEIIRHLSLMNNWREVQLKRISEKSVNYDYLKNGICKFSEWVSENISCISPMVIIDQTWDSYYKTVSKGLKQDIRTSRNKFKKLGELQFKDCHGQYLSRVFDKFIEFHKGRQDHKLGRSLFECKKNRAFIASLITDFKKAGWCDMTALQLNGNDISIVLSFKYRKRYLYWIPVFDPAYRKYSPGKLHFYMLLKKCFEQGYESFDFMRGDEMYKLRWATHMQNYHDIKIFRNYFWYEMDKAYIAVRKKVKSLYDHNEFIRKSLNRISKVS